MDTFGNIPDTPAPKPADAGTNDPYAGVYEAYAQKRETVSVATQNWAEAIKQDPVRYATYKRISGLMGGLDPAAILAHPDLQSEADRRAKTINVDAMFDHSPATVAWLAQSQGNTIAAQNDIGALGHIEALARLIWGAIPGGDHRSRAEMSPLERSGVYERANQASYDMQNPENNPANGRPYYNINTGREEVRGNLSSFVIDAADTAKQLPAAIAATWDAGKSLFGPPSSVMDASGMDAQQKINDAQRGSQVRKYGLGFGSDTAGSIVQSLPFSVFAGGAGLVGNLLGSRFGRAASYAAGAAASGWVGGALDRGMVWRQLYELKSKEYKAAYGRDITPAEFNAFVAQPEIASEIQKHYLFESVSEAGGNALMKLTFGNAVPVMPLGGPALFRSAKALAARLVSAEAPVKGALSVSKAAVLDALGEMTQEGVTQMGQNQAEAALKLQNAPAPQWTSLYDWRSAFSEIAYPTLGTVALVGGAAKVVQKPMAMLGDYRLASKIDDFVAKGGHVLTTDEQLADVIKRAEALALEHPDNTKLLQNIETMTKFSDARTLYAAALAPGIATLNAADGVGKLNALIETAAGTQMAGHSPDELGVFLQSVGGSVYIDQEGLQNAFAQTGEDLATVLPTAAEQLADGAAGAGPGVEVPVAELVKGLMGSKAREAVLQHVRMDADSATLAEAKSQDTAKMDAFFQESLKRIQDERATDKVFLAEIQQIQDDVAAGLDAVGIYTPTANRTQAKAIGAFYAVLADKASVTPLQLRDGWTDAAGVAHKGIRFSIGGAATTAPNTLSQGFNHGYAMLNVGLSVGTPAPGAQTIDAALVKAELAKMGVQVLSGEEVPGQYPGEDGKMVDELTYVPHLSRPLTADEMMQLTVALKQEAIPQYYNGIGTLHGTPENLAKYGGAFNPMYFKDQKGVALSDAQQELAQKKKADKSTEIIAGQLVEQSTPLTAKQWAAVREIAVARLSPEDLATWSAAEQEVLADIEAANRESDVLKEIAKEKLDGMPTPRVSTVPLLHGRLKLQITRTGKFRKDGTRKARIADVARALFVKFRNQKADIETPEGREAIARAMVHEALYSLSNDGHAVGWYDRKVREAITTFALVHPEVLTSPKHNLAFRLIAAVTSNGQPVRDNFILTNDIYKQWSESGVFPTEFAVNEAADTITEDDEDAAPPEEGFEGGGSRKPAMVLAFRKMNTLVEELGWENIQAELLEMRTVREIEKEFGLEVFGENKDTIVPTAVGLGGPKIGNFFANLSGYFDSPTMDLWFMRTSGRMAGTLLETKPSLLKHLIELRGLLPEKGDFLGFPVETLRKEIEKYGALTPEQRLDAEITIKTLKTVSQYVRARFSKFAQGDPVTGGPYTDKSPENVNSRRVLTTMAAVREVPSSGAERNDLRAVITRALELLEKQGISLTMADLQAVLWYHEKNLYSKLGDINASAKPWDYASAARFSVGRELGLVDVGTRQRAADVRAGQPAPRIAGGLGELQALGQEAQGGALYQELRRAGAVSGPVVGVHYSQQARTALSSAAFGQGMSGAERERIAASTDPRLKQRIAFYVNTGTGITPESGVGSRAHVATLTNLYDADADVLKLWRNNRGDLNAAESAVLDAGFDGYLKRDGLGAAVLLGPRSQAVEPVAGTDVPVVPSPQIPAAKAAAIALATNTSLISGRQTAAEWKKDLTRIDPEMAAKVEWEKLDQEKLFYRQDLADTLWQGREQWYFSALEVALKTAPAKVFGSGKAVAQWLRANAGKMGVKSAEIEATGITDWLETQDKVTKEQVAAFMAQGGVQIRDVLLGEIPIVSDRDIEPGETFYGYTVGTDKNDDYTVTNDYGDVVHTSYSREGVADFINDATESAPKTKFAEYIPPGGIKGTYSELLLTLPTSGEGGKRVRVYTRDGLSAVQVMTDAEIEAMRASGRRKFEVLDTVNPKSAFSSAHWDQPNVVAHVRYDYVMGADGKRYLRIIEIQSDWAQAGRKKGFSVRQTAPLAPGEYVNTIADWKDELAAKWADTLGGLDVARRAVANLPNESIASQLGKQAEFAALEARNNDDFRQIHPQGARFVPPAPFVTDTKAWTALAIKRMIAYAVDEKAPGIVFATGQQNADLYDLSTQVDAVRIAKNADGTFDLSAEKDGGDNVLDEINIPLARVEDLVGKDLARKAATQAANSDVTYAGLDLKVGGEGMRAFYDEIVPQVANDVLKKLGGGKVSPVDTSAGRVEKLNNTKFRVSLPDGSFRFFQSADNAQEYLDKFGVGPGDVSGFPITEAMRDIVRTQGLPLFAGTPKKGSFSPASMDMRLLADADLSTFLHEASHWFLAAYTQVASEPGAPQALVDEVNALLGHLGAGDLSAWNNMTLDQQRPYHEAWAESGEQYFMAGKAPSLALDSVFRTFANWLKRIYGSLKEFVAAHAGSQIHPTTAAFFDRMLATEAEIQQASEARGYVQLFKDAAEVGMTENAWAAYQAMDTEQREDAEAMHRARRLRDMKWLQNARTKIIGAMQKEAEDLRKEMKAAVAKELAATPLREAERWLKRGEFTEVLADGTKVERKVAAGHRLQISEVKAMFPEGALGDVPDISKLGYGQYGMLADVGLAPELVANMIGGFKGGEDLVRQLIDMKPFKEEVEELTDLRMLQDHSELIDQSAIERAADEAITNDAHIRMVATELSALAKGVGSPAQLTKAAKEYARQLIETKTSKTLKPWSFAAAAARARKAAMTALRKGERDEAAQQSRLDLLNTVATKMSYETEKEIKKIVDRFKKLAAYSDKHSSVESRDFATVQAVRAILADHGIGNKGEKAATYLETVAANDPAAALRLQEIIDVTSADPKHWSNIQISALRELAAAVDDIWFLAKRTHQMEVQGKMVRRADVVAQLYERVAASGDLTKRIPGEGYAPTPMEELANTFGTLKSVARRMDFVADLLDGQQVMGPWGRDIVGVMQDAAAALQQDMQDKLGKYYELLKSIEPSLKRGEIHAKELTFINSEGKPDYYRFGRDAGGSGKAELLHAILHTGNRDGGGSNYHKLLLGRDWGALREDGTLDDSKWREFIARMHKEGVLTKADYDFAQAVWDLMETMKPGAQKAHRIVHGKFFNTVTATPFTNEFGTYAGGYVPALTDTRIVKDMETNKLREAQNDNMTLAFPAPPGGFAKDRVAGYHRELRLDLRMLESHIHQVLLFTHMAVPVNDMRRVLGDKKLSAAINRLYPGMINSTFTPWLNRAAKHSTTLTSPEFGKLGSYLRAGRSNASTNTMMGNIANSIQQATGVIPASVDIGYKYLQDAMVHGLTNPKEVEELVKGKSSYMRVRIDSEVQAQMQNISQILINPNVYQKIQAWTKRHTWFLQSAVDNALSPKLWLAAYNQATEQHPELSEQDRVHIADKLVRETQGASGPLDISTFEAGHPFFQLFTQFIGYFNMMGQFLGSRFLQNLSREVGLPKKYARAFYIVGIGFYAQAVAAELIMMLFRGGPDDKDYDDHIVAAWLRSLGIDRTVASSLVHLGIEAPAKFGTALVPFIGNILVAGANAWNNKTYDDRIGNSPAIAALESGARLGPDTYKFLTKDGAPSKPIKDFAQIVGLFTGLPTGAAARPVGYLADVAAGKVNPTGPVDAVRGTITGTASPASKH